MKRLFLLITLSFIFLNNGWAIDKPEKVNVWKPSVLNTSLIGWDVAERVANSDDYGQKPEPSEKRFWIVYNDRENNEVYSDPRKKTVERVSLRMREELRIADIKNGLALVYKEPRTPSYPDISTDAKMIGWIPMKNLLLWKDCPTNKFGIYKKSILARNIDEYDKHGKSNNEPLEYVYNNPNAKIGTDTIKTGMNFFYIMKNYYDEGKKDTLYLLSNAPSVSSVNGYGSSIYGWVKATAMVRWEQATCLEPNWKKADVKKLDKTDVSAFDADGQAFFHVPFDFNNPDSPGKYEPYRMSGSTLRYPLLKTSKSSDTEETFTATFFDVPGKKGITNGRELGKIQSKTRETGDKVIKDIYTLNLIIVIDGTRSMEPYYSPVQKAISRVCEEDLKGGNYEPRVGLVIYRDYEDGEDNPENGLVEYVALSDPQDSKLNDYFRTGGKYGIKSSNNDKTNTEAVYEGIWLALDKEKMGYSEKHTNLLVIIGDCGNHKENKKDGPTKQQIIEKCAENNVNLLVFQVKKTQNINSNEWNAHSYFTEQTRDMLIDNFQLQLNNLSKESDKLAGIGVDVKDAADNNGYDLRPTIDSENSLFMGACRYPQAIRKNEKKEELTAEDLQKMLELHLRHFKNVVDRRSEIIDDFTNYVTEDQRRARGTMDDAYLSKTLGKDIVNQFKKSKDLVAKIGYTAKSSPKGADYWKPVVFISEEELRDKLKILNEVLRKAEGQKVLDNIRREYVTGMKAILEGMLPGQNLDKLKPSDVTKLMMGLNVSTNGLSGKYTFEQLTSTDAVPQKDFQGLYNDFKIKVEKLNKIQSDSKAFVYNFKDKTCYWIPVDELP